MRVTQRRAKVIVNGECVDRYDGVINPTREQITFNEWLQKIPRDREFRLIRYFFYGRRAHIIINEHKDSWFGDGYEVKWTLTDEEFACYTEYIDQF